ncbi:peptidase S8/S53 domain-containing protein [Schizothecium vesticola]|uniref:Peptidase S8/S53 domain-containing protein n=1 Tax=Schizothecium vesticola TaxID=314040 RepID=A0AA40ELI0_9PEZI|nr:peptidase S8/S53 domain-containing protein [Schizothecium vesticola]
MPEVESVEFIVEAIPAAPVFPIDDPRTVDQGYLNTAALGVDSRYAWERPGGDGEFASVVDVEWDWLLDHEDLAAANISIINPPLQRHSNTLYTDHGTAVMGEIFMVDNTKGGVGIAPKARARVSQVKENVIDAGLNAIFAAIDKMEFGEIMLIEMQASADTTVGSRQSPIEVYERDFQALRLATALGITVIEAGGNGGHDLDNPISVNGLPPRRSLNRNHADFRDSGAIVVGGSTKEVPHRRREGTGGDNEATNFGNRIDAYSWFEGIVTTAFSAQSNAAYQDGFGGTSGASPIVAGVAAVIQSMVQANLGFKISPLQMRRLIIMSGTSTANPAFDKLGLMPNLRGLIDGQYLHLPPDVYVRDVVGDDGNPRSGAITYASPDIITRQTQVANPTAQFGAGSGQENNDALSQTVLEGRENFIYIRARNRGSRTAQQVFADVYWTEASTVLNHNQESWRPVGRTMFSSGVGNVLTVSNALRWQAPAGVRDPILIAILGAEEDPATMPPEANFPSTVELSRFFHQNNNVAGKGTRT